LFIFVVFMCTSVLQIASFSGWECVECRHMTAISSGVCTMCNTDNREIAGDLYSLYLQLF